MKYTVMFFTRLNYNRYRYALCLDIPIEETVKSKIFGTYHEDIKSIVAEVSDSIPKEDREKIALMSSPEFVYRLCIDIFLETKPETYLHHCTFIVSKKESAIEED